MSTMLCMRLVGPVLSCSAQFLAACPLLLPRTCLFFASPNRMEAFWQLVMVGQKRCVAQLSFLLLPFRRGIAESACVPKEHDKSENILCGIPWESQNCSQYQCPPMVRHGHSGSAQPWSGTCYLSSLSLDALLERGGALCWLTVGYPMVYWKLRAQGQHALSPAWWPPSSPTVQGLPWKQQSLCEQLDAKSPFWGNLSWASSSSAAAAAMAKSWQVFIPLIVTLSAVLMIFATTPLCKGWEEVQNIHWTGDGGRHRMLFTKSTFTFYTDRKNRDKWTPQTFFYPSLRQYLSHFPS